MGWLVFFGLRLLANCIWFLCSYRGAERYTLVIYPAIVVYTVSFRMCEADARALCALIFLELLLREVLSIVDAGWLVGWFRL